MTAEVYAIIGLAMVVWITGARIIAKLDKLQEATFRPREPDGTDKVLETLGRIEADINSWRFSSEPSEGDPLGEFLKGTKPPS